MSCLKKTISVLIAIDSALQLFEIKITRVSEVYQIFSYLPGKMSRVGLMAAELKAGNARIKFCFNFIYGDARGIAYLVNPRYAGFDRDGSIQEAVMCSF
jgi:hypothetical protein